MATGAAGAGSAAASSLPPAAFSVAGPPSSSLFGRKGDGVPSARRVTYSARVTGRS